MKTYRAPGVYVVEDQSTPMPLSGVPTGIPCFFGFTHQGPSLQPTRITSLNEFTAVFGGKPKNRNVFPRAYMLDSVYAFFLNGGGECYVCRVNDGARASWSIQSIEDVVDFKRLEDPFDSSSPDDPDPALQGLKVEAISGGSWANGLRVRLRKTPAQPPRPNIGTAVSAAIPNSDAYKTVPLDRLKPIGDAPLPSGEGLAASTLSFGAGDDAVTGTWDPEAKAYQLSDPVTEAADASISVPVPKEPENPATVEVSYTPASSFDPTALTDTAAEAAITPQDTIPWNVSTRLEFENVQLASGKKTSLVGAWEPAQEEGEVGKFYLVDGDGNAVALTQDLLGGTDTLEGELQQPLRFQVPAVNEAMGLAFDLEVLEPVPPRNPGDATTYKVLEAYSGLSTNPADSMYFLKKEGLVNGVSNRIHLLPADDSGTAIAFSEDSIEGVETVSPNSPGGSKVHDLGKDKLPPSTEYAKYFPLLKGTPDVSLIACPDAYPDGPTTDAFVYQPIYQAAIDFAFDNRCMVVIDSPPQPAAREIGDLGKRAKSLETFADRFRSTHAAIYAPWFEAASLDPEADEKTLMVPPSGFILGAYNRSDNNVGVWKAPANMPVLGSLGMQLDFTEEQSEVLNPAGVNLTRNFPGQGRLIWGARTTTKNVMWRYVNVRRLFLYVERTLKQQTMWAVFESNDQRTWNKLVNAAEAFLRSLWRSGGLMGAAPEEAFQVSCGVPQTMTMEDVANGLLKVEIKIAPVRPAEFVVFTVSQLVQKQST